MRVVTPLPLILQINQESRNYGLKIYKPYLIASQDKKNASSIYMDPKRTTLLFELPRSVGPQDLKDWMGKRLLKLIPRATLNNEILEENGSLSWAPDKLSFVFMWGPGSRRWLGNCYFLALRDKQCGDALYRDFLEFGYTLVCLPFTGNYDFELMWEEVWKIDLATGSWPSFI